MTEPTSQDKPTEAEDEGRIPRPAIVVVLVGIVASLAIYGLSYLPGSSSVAIEWDTLETIDAPPAETVGQGSFAVARTSLSALAPNEEGLLIFRVAGVVRIDSAGRKPTRVRCDVASKAGRDTQMARSTKLRAAWPKPSDRLQAQDFPETSSVLFTNGERNKVDLPIRDVARRYTDSMAPTEVDWDGYIEDDQNWVWTMSDGTGTGAATLPWLVIFEAEERPRGTIDCVARVGSDQARIRIPYLQREWPIADDQPNAVEGDTGDVSNVE